MKLSKKNKKHIQIIFVIVEILLIITFLTNECCEFLVTLVISIECLLSFVLLFSTLFLIFIIRLNKKVDLKITNKDTESINDLFKIKIVNILRFLIIPMLFFGDKKTASYILLFNFFVTHAMFLYIKKITQTRTLS